jgi:hypothetical protein
MTGYPRWNFDAFADATAQLRARGYEVISPAERDLAEAFDPDAPVTEFSDADYAAAMRRDVEAVLTVDGIALLPGWEQSRGAQIEATLGRALGLSVAPVADFLASAGLHTGKVAA